MNQEAVLKQLAEILKRVFFHGDLIQDLHGILSKSGIEQAFLSLFLTRIKFLLEYSNNATKHEEFERLSHTSVGLYSMHLSRRGFNIRILYALLQEGDPVLLHAFSERAGKRVTSYENHIPIAEERLRSFLEEYSENEEE